MEMKTDIENGTPTSFSPKIHVDIDEEMSTTNKNKVTGDGTNKKNKWQSMKHTLVFILICIFSGGVGGLIFYGTRAPQLAVFNTQMSSCADQLKNSIEKGLKQNFGAAGLISKYITYSAKFADVVQTPPFYTVSGFQEVVKDIVTMADNIRSISWSPLVDTTNSATRPKWEAWAKKNIVSETAGLPGEQSIFNTINTTAYKYGMYNKTSPTTTVRAGDVVPGGDPRFSHWLFPLWQVAPLDNNHAPAIFAELHQIPHNSGTVIESVLQAGYGAKGKYSNLFQLVEDNYFRPSTTLVSAIYSMDSTIENPTLLGVSTVVFSWDTLLQHALPNSLERIDCVLITSTMTVSYSVDHGKVTILGLGDFHDPTMTLYEQSVDLKINDPSVTESESATDFTIKIYPSQDFYNQYVTSRPIISAIAAGVGVFALFVAIYVGRTYAQIQHEKIRNEAERLKQSQADAKVAEAEAEKEKAAKEREMQLTLELQENIANSAHDMKSPACALSLAVNSLMRTFYGKTHMDQDGCKMTVETLTGIMHTLSSLNTIINRSVDAATALTGRTLKPKMGSIEIRELLSDVLVFMQWQAEGSKYKIVSDPFPDLLPTDILADLKWLREDLMCLASNALKFSQERSMVPVIVRLTIDTDTDDKTPMLCFSFIDSGHNLSVDRFSSLFDYPKMRSSERMGMGGMGLGLYCLRQRVTAMEGRCGARVRRDGLEGTEVWFCIPLLIAENTVNSFELLQQTPRKSRIETQVEREVSVVSSFDAATVELSSSHHERHHKSRNISDFITAIGGSGRPSATTLKSRPSMQDMKMVSFRHCLDRISEEKGGVLLPILIVDDSVTIMRLTIRSLLNEMPDLVIKEARDGDEAFDRVQEEKNGFHIIITDIQMPRCDGFDFTRRVREFEYRNRLNPTMIIGISANYQEKIVIESQQAGMDGFMHKPFQLETLLSVINHVQLHRDLQKQLDKMDPNSMK